MIGPYILDQYVHLFFSKSYEKIPMELYALHAQIAAHEVTNTLERA